MRINGFLLLLLRPRHILLIYVHRGASIRCTSIGRWFVLASIVTVREQPPIPSTTLFDQPKVVVQSRFSFALFRASWPATCLLRMEHRTYGGETKMMVNKTTVVRRARKRLQTGPKLQASREFRVTLTISLTSSCDRRNNPIPGPQILIGRCNS